MINNKASRIVKTLDELREIANSALHEHPQLRVSYIDSIFPACKNISIDYGVMEKSDSVYVFPADFGWSDLGTWGSLYAHLDLDKNRNAVQGSNVFLYDSADNIVKIPHEKLVVLQGLNGYIVVENDNILLVCKKEDEQQIKEFVANIKKKSIN